MAIHCLNLRWFRIIVLSLGIKTWGHDSEKAKYCIMRDTSLLYLDSSDFVQCMAAMA
jgi:hypothetical protein